MYNTDAQQRVFTFTKHINEVQAKTIATANELGLYEGDIVTYNGVEGCLHLGIGVSIELDAQAYKKQFGRLAKSDRVFVVAIGGVELLDNITKVNSD